VQQTQANEILARQSGRPAKWIVLEYTKVDSLKRNIDVVLAAVAQNAEALKFADESLRCDPRVLTALARQPSQ